jgi:predicted signal transduction protein with EAL and GGDEF domain
LTEVISAEGAQVCTEKLLIALEEPYILKQGEAKVGASIGIGMFPIHGATLDALLRSADQAMYLSKSRGKNTFTFAGE